MPSAANTFESRVAGVTVTGRAHALSAWFVLALRFLMGYVFIDAGVTKVLDPGWTAAGHLAGAAASGTPLSGLFASLTGSSWIAGAATVVVPWAQIGIGIALLVGAFVRLAAFLGALAAALAYVGTRQVEAGLVDGDLLSVVVLLAIGAFGAGRILGLDAHLERVRVGGRPLVDRYPVLGFLLG